MRWRRLQAELLACLTLQPERTDAEHVNVAVSPLPAQEATSVALPVNHANSGGAGSVDLHDKGIPLSRASPCHGHPLVAGPQAQPVQTLAILYGADGGSSSTVLDIAGFIAGEAASRGLSAKLPVTLDAGALALDPSTCAVIVCAGGAGGEPPRNATAFFGTLLNAEAGRRFKNMQFALLGVALEGLADQEMRAPRLLRQRLLACGAVELVPAGEFGGVDEVLEPWVASLWKPLQMLLQPANGDDTIKAVPATLYDRMGGSDAVAALAVETVRRGLADWRIKRFLEGAQDAAAQAQTAQWLGSALGGPLTYRGPDPSALYSRLAAEKGLNGTHLDTLAQHVAGAMAEMGLSADMIDGLLAALAVHRQGWT